MKGVGKKNMEYYETLARKKAYSFASLAIRFAKV
jgi:hypothetical protein